MIQYRQLYACVSVECIFSVLLHVTRAQYRVWHWIYRYSKWEDSSSSFSLFSPPSLLLSFLISLPSIYLYSSPSPSSFIYFFLSLLFLFFFFLFLFLLNLTLILYNYVLNLHNMDKSKRERKVASRWRNFKRMLLIKRNLYCLSKYQTKLKQNISWFF